jgi:hypothetical protein
MARITCDTAIEEMFGKNTEAKVNPTERKKLIKLLQDYKLKNFKDDPQGFKEFAQDSLNRYRVAVQKQRLARAKSLLLMESHLSRFRSDPKYMENPYEFMRSILTGTEGSAKGANDSVALNRKSLRGMFSSRMHVELQKAGLDEAYYSGKLDREIFRAYTDLTTNGVIKNSPEYQIAKILNNVDKAIVQAKKQYGSNMEAMDNHLIKQMHNPDAIRKAGYEAWAADVRKVFRESLDDIEATDKDYLPGLYNKIINNEFQMEFGTPEFEEFGKTKIFDSLDKRLSKQRFFKWDDPDLAYEYFQKYGGGQNLSEAFLSKINNSARDVSILKVLGAAPATTYKNLMSQIASEIKDNPKALEQLRTNKQFLEELYNNEIRGLSSRASDNIYTKISNATRAVDSAALLGGASVAAGFTDTVLAAMTTKNSFGDGFFTGVFQNMNQFFKTTSMSKKEKMEFAAEMATVVDRTIGDSLHRFGSDSANYKEGLLNKTSNLIMKASGMNWQTRNATFSVATLHAKRLADLAGAKFSDNKALADGLQRYGINEQDWMLISKAVSDFSGTKYITPEAVDRIPDDLVQKAFDSRGAKDLTKYRNAKEYRANLKLELSNYLVDAADSAVLKSGSYENTILFGNTRVDTAKGMFARMVFRFNQFPVAMTRVLRRSSFSNKEGMNSSDFLDFQNWGSKIDTMNLVQLALGLTAMGYMSKSLKDIAAGKEPQDPSDPAVLADSFIAGGAAGIYTDFFAMLLSDQRYGGSALAELGPMGKNIDSIGQIARSMFDEKEGSTTGKIFRLAYKNAPGNNLFYTKMVTDQLFYYSVLNEIEPEYTRKLLRAEKKRGVERFVDISP